jgi:transposase InsO family protein
VKFAYIAQQRGVHAVRTMCQVLDVSKSGYYAWLQRGESARAREDHELSAEIARIHDDSGKRYGSPRVWQTLRKRGQKHSRKRIARLMAKRGLYARRKKRFVRTTRADPAHQPSDNLLKRDFHADEPNRKWVADIKHIPTGEGDLYLAATLDLFSRRVVGWAMEDTLAATLTSKALDMALRQRQPAADALLHSDRGSQYTAAEYRQVLEHHDLRQSMSRTGNVWDNAVMEAFFSTLEFECLRGRHFATRAQAKTEVFSYIETFYNRKRLHSTLDYVSPDEFEARHQTTSTVH